MTRAAIIGTGYHVPSRVVTNDDLAQWMDTTDEWITERSGIKERRWLPQGEDGWTEITGAEMGAAAARMAIEDAGIEAEKIDLVLSDMQMPGRSGMELLSDIKIHLDYQPLVVMMTAFGTIELALEATRKGAQDFLADLPLPTARIRDRMLERARGAAFVQPVSRALMPGWLDQWPKMMQVLPETKEEKKLINNQSGGQRTYYQNLFDTKAAIMVLILL